MADEKPDSAPETPAAEGAEGAEAEEAAAAPPEPHPLVTALQAQFPDRFTAEDEDTAGNPIVRVGVDDLIEVLTWLRDDETTRFDFLADQTVIDWTEREPRFDVVYHLYSIPKNHFLTVKVGCADGEGVPTVCDIWGTANWHEREAYDLYGVEFLGHPELERIFLPEDWEGFPLRKDYPLEGPNLELLTRQQAAFRGGRFDRIRGDYEMTEQERKLTSAGIVGPLWTPKPPPAESPESPESSDAESGGGE
jgi:NADH-quinone oxidoreductase subunit C